MNKWKTAYKYWDNLINITGPCSKIVKDLAVDSGQDFIAEFGKTICYKISNGFQKQN